MILIKSITRTLFFLSYRELVSRKSTSAGKVVFFEETSAMLAQKKKYARHLLAIRPRDVTLEDASGLCVKSTDLFVWAIESSERYFEMTEAAKYKVVSSPLRNENHQKLILHRIFLFILIHSQLNFKSITIHTYLIWLLLFNRKSVS